MSSVAAPLPLPSAAILVVEDDLGVATLERRRLQRAGYEVSIVATAEAALARVRQGDIDLIVLDQSLPGGLTGLDFFRDVRAAGFAVPVIMVTGQSNETMIIQALRLGVNDFVTKSPAYLDYLPEAVARVLAQVRTEQRLAISEQRFRATFEQAAVGIAQIGLDDVWQVVNQKLCEIVGRGRAEVLARGWHGLLTDEDRAAEAADRRRLLEGEELPARERRIQRPDGVGLWLSQTVSLIRDQAGQPLYVMSVVEDITARKRIEAEREWLLFRERLLAEAGAAVSASLDAERTLAALAHLLTPRLADWCAVDLVEGHETRLVALAHADPGQEDLIRRLRALEPTIRARTSGLGAVLWSAEPELRAAIDPAERRRGARDDEHLAVLEALDARSSLIVPLVARGRPIGALTLVYAGSGRRYGPDELGLVRELADRAALAVENARLFAETQAALRARDTFLSIASHELRTPITSIKGFIQVLLRHQERGRLDVEQVAAALPIMRHGAERLTSLVDDLLDVSRIRLGRLLLRLQPVDLVDLLRTLVDHRRMLAGPTHPLALRSTIDQAPMLGDPSRLEQVVTNLLDNAVTYSPDGGPIEISLSAQGQGWLLRVRDQGIGLPPGMAEAIFEPFGRAANVVERQPGGLGLGLYISRMIIDQHGGQIRAESAGEGQGTTIVIWLPADAESAPRTAAARPDALPPTRALPPDSPRETLLH